MIKEENLKEVPITIETAHQFFSKRQMSFIVKLYKENYKLGFKHGLKINKAILMLLFTCLSFGQSGIVASGSSNITIGEVFPIMQTIEEEKEVTLSTPKFEIPIEQPKIVKKKLTIFDKIINLIKKLFKK